jgi:anti-sigma factor (TIGR02949 family)
MSRCEEIRELLGAYLDGELGDPEVLSRLEAHLGHCRSCYSRAEMEKALNERMAGSARVEVPPALRQRVRDLLDKL